MRPPLVVAIALALVPSAAVAHPWHLQGSVGTDFPIALGARLDVEGPYRLRLSTSVGTMPGAYVDAINGIAIAAGWFTQSEADLIRVALRSSFVWRTHLGWRPWARHGFTAMVGYGLVTLGGGASAEQLITGVTGAMPPSHQGGSTSMTYSYAVTSTLHMIDVEVGWEWLFLRDRLVVQAALGFAGTLSSRTTITPQYTPRFPQATANFAAYAAGYLDDTLQAYVFSPVATVTVGYRFF